MESRLSLGPFDLVKQIGKGTMGVVWEGVHRSQALPVAIKILTAVGEQDDTFRQAFTNEVRAVARLHHPSIINLLDYGVTDEALSEASEGFFASGSQYYAMELATGGTLPKPKAPLPWVQMRFLLLELLDALAHAHARDVIHRDIKPGNILLMQEGEYSRVMLTDFGIAKAVGVKELQDGVVAGTPRYMAPEQILNATRDQGPWTDLYSLGCIAYQFATGKRIFAHAKGTDILRCQLHEDPEPVTGRHLPEGFQKWLSKMLAKKVMDRFEYAAEAAWELLSLPEPEVAEPEKSTVNTGQSAVPDSNDYSVAGEGVVSSIFNTLYPHDQQPTVGFEHDEDIAEELLADVGDTVRMDTADIARVISQNEKLSHEKASGLGQELTTLAEVYRQRGNDTGVHGGSAFPAPKTWRIESNIPRFGQLLGAGLGLWGLRSIPMVDRDNERDIIYAQLLSTRADNTPRAVVLDGPRGTGKSRIVEWMSQRAHELSLAHTLKANHYEDHLNAPGIARAIMYYLACQNMTRDKALERVKWILAEHPLDPEYDDAMPLVELMMLPDNPDNPIPGIRFNTIEEQYAVLCRFMRRICHDRAVVLWLDDCHYSTYSMDFVHFMLTSEMAQGIPLLILATTRSEDIARETSREIAYKQMMDTPRVTRMSIAPLPSDAHLQLVHELIGLDDELCTQVAQRTSGMPLFAIQLVGDWVERGLLEPGATGFRVKDNASVALPDSLHELWLSRLRLIFADSKRMSTIIEQLEIAAVLGAQFDADEWRIACEMSDLGSCFKTQERMLEHWLFEVKYPTVRFVHELLRESLLRNARENNRFRQHHLVCADMLQNYFSSALDFYHERRAMHLYAAEAYESCIEPLLQAAIQRRQRSEYGVAHSLIHDREIALDKCQADENSPIRALGWIADANTYIQEVKLEAAEPLIEKALEIGLRTHSPIVQALAYKEKGLLLNLRNNIPDALDALMAALSFFGQISERRRNQYQNDRADNLWLIGRICDIRHELDLARNYFQQAIEIQTQTHDQYGLGRSYKSLGNTYLHGGCYEDARINTEYAYNIFQQMGFRIYIAHCLNDIGEIYRLGYHQPEQAEAYYRNAMSMYREVSPLEGCTTLINLVLLLIDKRQFSEAKLLVLEQIEKMESVGQTFDLNWLYAELLPCCAATFDWPTFNDAVLRLGKSLEDSMVVDADILFCTELASQLCDRYASREQGRLCREIAIQQAVRLNDRAALARLNQ